MKRNYRYTSFVYDNIQLTSNYIDSFCNIFKFCVVLQLPTMIGMFRSTARNRVLRL